MLTKGGGVGVAGEWGWWMLTKGGADKWQVVVQLVMEGLHCSLLCSFGSDKGKGDSASLSLRLAAHLLPCITVKQPHTESKEGWRKLKRGKQGRGRV